MRSALDVRRLGSALPWRQVFIVLAGVAVIFAMVAIANKARRDERHDQQVQILADQVRAASDEVGLLMQPRDQPRRTRISSTVTQFIRLGTEIYSNLTRTLTALRRVDNSAATQALEQDTVRLYSPGDTADSRHMASPNAPGHGQGRVVRVLAHGHRAGSRRGRRCVRCSSGRRPGLEPGHPGLHRLAGHRPGSAASCSALSSTGSAGEPCWSISAGRSSGAARSGSAPWSRTPATSSPWSAPT